MLFGLTDDQIEFIKFINNGKIPIDHVFYVYEDTQKWFNIKGFNGYQYSPDTNTIRSYKFKNQFPYGTIVLPKNNKYELSDNDNMRIKTTLTDLLPFIDYSVAYSTNYTMPVSRNIRLGINQDPELTAQKKGLVRKSVPVNKKESTAMARFTVTDNPKPLI